MSEWKGEERRSIPIHILNHIDERLSEHADRVETQLGEMNRRIQQLTMSINSWMEKEPVALREDVEDVIDELIPTHPENPQATKAEKRSEHRKAHARWIKNVEEEMDRWKHIRESVASWAIIAVIGVIAMALWEYVIRGPR